MIQRGLENNYDPFGFGSSKKQIKFLKKTWQATIKIERHANKKSSN